MLLLFFFINFNYTVLRDTKDALIVTAPGSGAEAITFLKVWGVVPVAALFMILYAKLSNTLSKTSLFYATVIPFVIFFGLFAFVFYPMRDMLHPHGLADQLQALLPKGFSGLIAIFRNWTFSLFYIMAELWGTFGISVLFWTFANDITKVGEAKRFYALFGIGANIAMVLSGPLIMKMSKIQEFVPAGVDPWGVSLKYLMTLVVVAGLCTIGIYWWINKYVLTDARFYNTAELKAAKKEKPKMSLKESFLYLTRSKYLGCIALLVIAYGISINLVEVTWKSQLKLQYPNPNDYNHFMGLFSTIVGPVTIFMMLFVSRNIIQRFGWGVAAQITPVVLLITGVGFFSFVIFRDVLTGFIAALHTTPLMLAVIFGMAQNIASKSSKYSLFDPTKEMTYIPLDQESKIKGKAAIDGVGGRMGKSGGALIQQGLILCCGSIAAITPYVAGILFFIIFVWIFAAKSLSKQFANLTAEKEKSKETIDVKDAVLKNSEQQA